MGAVKLVSKTRIYTDMYQIFSVLLELSMQFPKAYKYTVGSEMQKLCISCMQCISRAYITRDLKVRIDALTMMQCDYEVLKALVRTACVKGWIKGKGKQGHLVELMFIR